MGSEAGGGTVGEEQVYVVAGSLCSSTETQQTCLSGLAPGHG